MKLTAFVAQEQAEHRGRVENGREMGWVKQRRSMTKMDKREEHRQERAGEKCNGYTCVGIVVD